MLSHYQVLLLYTFRFPISLNTLPEAVYCCFTRTTLFTIMFTVIIVVCLLKAMCLPMINCCVSELHGHLCPYRNVIPEAVLLLYKNYIVYRNLTFLISGRYGYLLIH